MHNLAALSGSGPSEIHRAWFLAPQPPFFLGSNQENHRQLRDNLSSKIANLLSILSPETKIQDSSK